MMGCCIAMVAGAGIVVAGSLAATGSVDWTGTLLPLLICGGAHVAMMVFMGRSCHTSSTDEQQNAVEADHEPATRSPHTAARQRAVERADA